MSALFMSPIRTCPCGGLVGGWAAGLIENIAISTLAVAVVKVEVELGNN